MEIKLTANAGVLINLDGVSILLDGVCSGVQHYLATPNNIRKELTECFPDAVGFTHTHSDHYDEDYANLYKNKTLRPVLGSECSSLKVGNVEIKAIPTRHIGKSDVLHHSFIINGSKRILFMGDASPLVWSKIDNLPEFDVLIVPFAYCNTASAWERTLSFNAEKILLVHMPSRENDPYMIWKSVEETTKCENILFFEKIGDTITL